MQTPPCNPQAGSLVPIALRLNNFDTGAQQVLRAIVTTSIATGTILGFRFFTPTNGYLSPTATSITFAISGALIPGDFVEIVRLAPGAGTALVRVQFGPAACTPGSVVRTTYCISPMDLDASVAGMSCFLYWSPPRGAAPIVALSAIAGAGLGAGDPIYFPPPCELPCQYLFNPGVNLGTDFTVVGPPIGIETSKGNAIYGVWHDVWQLCRYRAWVFHMNAPSGWDTIVNAASAKFYIAPIPGALIPLAVRPHIAGSVAQAELVVVATTTIPASTVIQISASMVSDTPPYWTWTTPSTYDIVPGTVVDFVGLGVEPACVPAVNIGTISLPITLHPGENLTEFTLFSLNPCAPLDTEGYTYITALYTCARPTGYILPPGLVAGQSMPAAPWPAPCNSIVCQSVRPEAWPMAAWALCNLRPILWTWQPVPCFRTKDPCCFKKSRVHDATGCTGCRGGCGDVGGCGKVYVNGL